MNKMGIGWNILFYHIVMIINYFFDWKLNFFLGVQKKKIISFLKFTYKNEVDSCEFFKI
jgi:hypothetical protein